jgi:hypothetical protein
VFVTRKTTPRGGTFVKNFALEKGRSLDLLRERRYIGKRWLFRPLAQKATGRAEKVTPPACTSFFPQKSVRRADAAAFGRARRGSLRSVL